jgi:hypothetical protein
MSCTESVQRHCLAASGTKQRNAEPLYRSAQLAARHREEKKHVVSEDPKHRFRRSEMKAVVATQAIARCEVSGSADDPLDNLQKFPDSATRHRGSAVSRKRAAPSHDPERPAQPLRNPLLGDRMGSGQPCFGSCCHNLRRACHLCERLDPCRRVQMKGHPRCSFPISTSVFHTHRCGLKALAKTGFLSVPGRTQGKLRKLAICLPKQRRQRQ